MLIGSQRSPLVSAPGPTADRGAGEHRAGKALAERRMRWGVACAAEANAVDRPVEAIKLVDVRIAAAQAAMVVFMTTSSDCCPPGLRLLNAPRHLLILNEA